MKKFLKKTEGFTLVELIVVIAILGILTAIAVPAYTGYIEKAQEAGDTQAVGAILTAAQGAMAKEGTVDEVRVDVTNKVIAAVIDDDVYVLAGETDDADNVIEDDEALTTDTDLSDIQKDFATYYGGNGIPTFKQKAPIRDDEDNKEDVANFAAWNDSKWSFEHIPTT